MDNAISIAKFPKLSNLIKKLIERLGGDWSGLLGHDVILEITGGEIVRSGQIRSKMTVSKVLMEYAMDMGEKSSERFYLMFFYQDAVVICGTILKHGEEKIREMFSSPNMNKEYEDVFREFCKQTSKGLNEVFCAHLRDKTNVNFYQHLISPKDNDELKRVFPASGEQLIFVVGLQHHLLNFGEMDIDMLFPLELVEGFCGETIYFSKTKNAGRILVVDDSKSDIAILRKHLRDNSYMIVEGDNEQSALYQIFSEKVDLVLLDIYLEDENGLSICRKIRRNMLCDSIPIIMFSCGATKENIVKSLRVGAQDFIAKPFDKDILLKKVIKYMQSKEKGVRIRY